MASIQRPFKISKNIYLFCICNDISSTPNQNFATNGTQHQKSVTLLNYKLNFATNGTQLQKSAIVLTLNSNFATTVRLVKRKETTFKKQKLASSVAKETRIQLQYF